MEARWHLRSVLEGKREARLPDRVQGLLDYYRSGEAQGEEEDGKEAEDDDEQEKEQEQEKQKEAWKEQQRQRRKEIDLRLKEIMTLIGGGSDPEDLQGVEGPLVSESEASQHEEKDEAEEEGQCPLEAELDAMMAEMEKKGAEEGLPW